MAREAKPWFRAADGWWYVCHWGKQIKLAKGRDSKAEALKAFHRLMADDIAKIPDFGGRSPVAQIADLFLDHVSKHNEPRTYEQYRYFLQGFCEAVGSLAVAKLKPFHLRVYPERRFCHKRF